MWSLLHRLEFESGSTATEWNGKTVTRFRSPSLTLTRRAHVGRHIACEKILARRRKDINDLGILWKDSFVLGVAGYHRNVARDHRLSVISDAEIHLALEHPNDLLMRMPMSGGVRTCFHFPPYNHSLLPCQDTALDFVGYTLPRQLRKCAEARHNRHDGPSLWLHRAAW